MGKYTLSQTARFIERVRALNPPENVLTKFLALVEAADVPDNEDTLEDLLMDAAKRENWTLPWEVGPEVRLTLRACTLSRDHPDFRNDCGGSNSPGEEQAYRRGVSHGCALTRRALVKKGVKTPPSVVRLEKEVDRWRRSRIHSRDALLWTEEPSEPDYPCTVRMTKRRSHVGPKLRFQVLRRDGRRCRICGQSASDGAALEVDHIRPRSRGGADTMDNLQTLCFDCNSGKGDFFV